MRQNALLFGTSKFKWQVYDCGVTQRQKELHLHIGVTLDIWEVNPPWKRIDQTVIIQQVPVKPHHTASLSQLEAFFLKYDKSVWQEFWFLRGHLKQTKQWSHLIVRQSVNGRPAVVSVCVCLWPVWMGWEADETLGVMAPTPLLIQNWHLLGKYSTQDSVLPRIAEIYFFNSLIMQNMESSLIF